MLNMSAAGNSAEHHIMFQQLNVIVLLGSDANIIQSKLSDII